MSEYKIVFTDKILDNVHGFIGLTEVESEIVELPIFKRLRHLKQLSLANWVFPGAEHTRYIHSLGVMHVIDQMAIRLHYDAKERQLVRLAGLLHDLGHYPLSHVGEASYKKDSIVEPLSYIENAKILCKQKIDKLQFEEIEIDSLMSVHGNQFHHERITETLIKNNKQIHDIINKHCDFIKIDQICAIITGNVEYDENISDKVQLLHSELDADRIDYLMRDATFSGTSYGAFGLGLLLANLECTKVNGIKIIGVSPKGIPSADQFLINRFFSYGQIVFNKHVSVLGFMAQKIMEHERIVQTLFPSSDELCNYIKTPDGDKRFLRFTDTVFWDAVRTISDSMQMKNREIEKFANKLSAYSEIEYIPDSEIRFSGKTSCAFRELKSSKAYKRLLSKNGILPICDVCKITNQVPKKVFEAFLKKRVVDNELKETYRIRRLQEGLAVIDKGEVHLLVDDKRSMMSCMYNMGIYLLREYK